MIFFNNFYVNEFKVFISERENLVYINYKESEHCNNEC